MGFAKLRGNYFDGICAAPDAAGAGAEAAGNTPGAAGADDEAPFGTAAATPSSTLPVLAGRRLPK